jgi:hypothetical protein
VSWPRPEEFVKKLRKFSQTGVGGPVLLTDRKHKELHTWLPSLLRSWYRGWLRGWLRSKLRNGWPDFQNTIPHSWPLVSLLEESVLDSARHALPVEKLLRRRLNNLFNFAKL